MKKTTFDHFIHALTLNKFNPHKYRVHRAIKKHLKQNRKMLDDFAETNPRKINPQLLKIGNLGFEDAAHFEGYLKEYFTLGPKDDRIYSIDAKFRKGEQQVFRGCEVGSLRLDTLYQNTFDLVLIDITTFDIFYCDTRLFRYKEKK